MSRWKRLPLLGSILVALGVCTILLVTPQPAQADGVHLSIGIGVPNPVYVAPAPIVVRPAPNVVYPGVIYPPPVVYTVPIDIYGRPLPPGLAKKFHGHHRSHHHREHGYNFYKSRHGGW